MNHLDYIILDRTELDKRAVVKTFDDAAALLREWKRSAAPGGEDVRFIVIWRDGSFRGDYRLERAEEAPDLRDHIRRHLEFVGAFMGPEDRTEAEARLA